MSTTTGTGRRSLPRRSHWPRTWSTLGARTCSGRGTTPGFVPVRRSRSTSVWRSGTRAPAASTSSCHSMACSSPPACTCPRPTSSTGCATSASVDLTRNSRVGPQRARYPQLMAVVRLPSVGFSRSDFLSHSYAGYAPTAPANSLATASRYLNLSEGIPAFGL